MKGTTLQVRESTYATKSCCPRRRVQDDDRRPQHYCCQTYVGGFYRVLHVGQMMAPTTLLVSRGMWGEPYRACHGMRVDDTYNTVGQMSMPTTLLGF